jgi:hypothetical protein
MPRWVVVALAAQAAALVGVGAALLVVPAEAASWWPWTLTPLTARAIGAWLVAIGASAAQAAREADFERTRAGMLGYAAIAALALLALARFPETVEWSDPAAWVLVAFVAGMLATGVLASAAAARARAAPAAAPERAGAIRR